VQPSILDQQEALVLEHWRKPTATRPRTEKRLLSFLIAHFGHKITETEALDLIRHLSQAGHLVIDDKGKVAYTLESK